MASNNPFPRGAAHHNWSGGRKVSHGYVLVAAPGHPNVCDGGYVREHILVAEKALGRLLPERAQVHHIDRDRSNNAPSNLVICENQAYHFLLHRRQRAFAACGDPNARPCVLCKRYDRQADMSVKDNGYAGSARHRDCHARAEYMRKRAKQLEMPL